MLDCFEITMLQRESLNYLNDLNVFDRIRVLNNPNNLKYSISKELMFFVSRKKTGQWLTRACPSRCLFGMLWLDPKPVQ
jgi:hypothetical protein